MRALLNWFLYLVSPLYALPSGIIAIVRKRGTSLNEVADAFDRYDRFFNLP
jgi:hypothetical protein